MSTSVRPATNKKKKVYDLQGLHQRRRKAADLGLLEPVIWACKVDREMSYIVCVFVHAIDLAGQRQKRDIFFVGA